MLVPRRKVLGPDNVSPLSVKDPVPEVAPASVGTKENETPEMVSVVPTATSSSRQNGSGFKPSGSRAGPVAEITSMVNVKVSSVVAAAIVGIAVVACSHGKELAFHSGLS